MGVGACLKSFLHPSWFLEVKVDGIFLIVTHLWEERPCNKSAFFPSVSPVSVLPGSHRQCSARQPVSRVPWLKDLIKCLLCETLWGFYLQFDLLPVRVSTGESVKLGFLQRNRKHRQLCLPQAALYQWFSPAARTHVLSKSIKIQWALVGSSCCRLNLLLGSPIGASSIGAL